MVISWGVGKRQDNVDGLAFAMHGWLVTNIFVVEKYIDRVDGNQCN